ncbi:hypothetical protein KIH41_09560 [Litoribacter ruber]|uniref:hypothetical protein n=1 Tax=Litoribacter ruber TaxID=702568 RepID=UPI001BDA7BD2|nr:hypothetical protein [Litoribacter ruber]MBT0811523.1 hypothetical protein [Litoribacter ruber]
MNSQYGNIRRKLEQLEEQLELGQVDGLEERVEAVLVKLKRLGGKLNDLSSMEYFGLRSRIQDLLDEAKSDGGSLLDRMYPFGEEEDFDGEPMAVGF